jgi:hypothetical protein
MLLVRADEELFDLFDLGFQRFRVLDVTTGYDVPPHASELVLARLNDQAQQIVAVCELAQHLEGDRLVWPGTLLEVVARGVIEDAAPDAIGRGGRKRVERAEPAVAGVLAIAHRIAISADLSQRAALAHRLLIPVFCHSAP